MWSVYYWAAIVLVVVKKEIILYDWSWRKMFNPSKNTHRCALEFVLLPENGETTHKFAIFAFFYANRLCSAVAEASFAWVNFKLYCFACFVVVFFACRSAPIDARRRNMAVRAKCIAEIKETPFEPPHYISSYGYCRGSQLPFISDAFSDGYTQSCLVTGLCNVCTANMFRVLGERMKGK